MTSSAMSGVVYIPIEKKNRELRAKLLVSLALLQGGADIVLGFQRSVLAVAFEGPPGIIFYKGLNKVQHGFMRAMSRVGHRAVAIDEESLASSDPKFLMLNCWSEIGQAVDMVFCQGSVQYQALIDHRGVVPERLKITGNPRIDLLRPPLKNEIARDAHEIRRRIGSFVLINTDYGSINNVTMDADGFREIVVQVGYLDPTNPEDLKLMEDRLTHDRNAMASVEAFILAMNRAAPKRKLVLRPHPTESDTVWRRLAERVDNLTVVTGTRAPEWIMAADYLVQTGCTTGLEAAVLGIPTIGMVCQPDDIVHPGLVLTHHINPVLRSVDAVVDAIGRLDAGTAPELGPRWEEKLRLLEPHVYINPEKFAFEQIAESILDMQSQRTATWREINPISDETDQMLRRQVTRVRFEDAYFTRDDLERDLIGLSDILGIPWNGQVRDLGWGAYAISRA